MGRFYGNIVLRNAPLDRAGREIDARRAAVVEASNGHLIVLDAACDDQNVEEIGALAATLSDRLACPAFASIVHDDDVFYYQCYENGALVDEYNSKPNYFDFNSAPSIDADRPAGGDAEQLCRLFGREAVAEVARILRRSDYVFETDRHADLVRALGLPRESIDLALAVLDDPTDPDGVASLPTVRASNPPEVEDQQTRWDRAFCDALGPEDPSRPCRRDRCQAGAVPMSSFCRKHHFESVQGRPFPL